MTTYYNFEWNGQKDHDNLKKHGIGFEEAATIFKDPRTLTIFDPDHSESDQRWVTMGISDRGRLLVVIHTFRESGDGEVAIRIISCRKATKNETHMYGGQS